MALAITHLNQPCSGDYGSWTAIVTGAPGSQCEDEHCEFS